MIISHKHKFIFLKTTKTAGTSIEIALSEFCGPDDVITPISPEDEKIRKQFGYRGPQNFRNFQWKYGIRGMARLFRKGYSKHKFYNHMTAGEVRHHVGQEVWNSYFKFCVERNPWDRAVSLYYWLHKSKPRPNFSSFIKSDVPLRLKRRGFNIYTINGQIAVDKICLYENLREELEAIRKELNIPKRLSLPRAKSRFRKDSKHYYEYFGEDERARIEEIFSDEIKLFGYQFQ